MSRDRCPVECNREQFEGQLVGFRGDEYEFETEINSCEIPNWGPVRPHEQALAIFVTRKA